MSEKWKSGSYVWAAFNKKYWPAIVISHMDANMKKSRDNYVYVVWFGEHRISELHEESLQCFMKYFSHYFRKFSNQMGKSWKQGVMEAIKEYGAPNTLNLHDDNLIAYAENYLQFKFKSKTSLPDFVLDVIHIRKNVTWKHINTQKKLSSLRKCLEDKENINQICIGCYDKNIAKQHPLFNASLCIECWDKLRHGFYDIGYDGLYYFCSICGNSGNVLACDVKLCGRSYCRTCLKYLAAPDAVNTILETNPWHCFLCTGEQNAINGLLVSRSNWIVELQHMLSPNIRKSSLTSIKLDNICVLAKFAGKSTGKVKNLNVPDKRALMYRVLVLSAFFPNVKYLFVENCEKNFEGFITLANMIFNPSFEYHLEIETNSKITRIKDINTAAGNLLPKLDLLIGGTNYTITDFPKEDEYDYCGIMKIFFQFYRVLNICKTVNSSSSIYYWVFELPTCIPMEARELISRFLGSDPCLIEALACLHLETQFRLVWSGLGFS